MAETGWVGALALKAFLFLVIHRLKNNQWVVCLFSLVRKVYEEFKFRRIKVKRRQGHRVFLKKSWFASFIPEQIIGFVSWCLETCLKRFWFAEQIHFFHFFEFGCRRNIMDQMLLKRRELIKKAFYDGQMSRINEETHFCPPPLFCLSHCFSLYLFLFIVSSSLSIAFSLSISALFLCLSLVVFLSFSVFFIVSIFLFSVSISLSFVSLFCFFFVSLGLSPSLSLYLICLSFSFSVFFSVCLYFCLFLSLSGWLS